MNFVSRLMGRRKPKLTRTVENLTAAVDRRSLREMQNLLFKIKRDYRAAHRESAPLQKLKKQFGFTVEAALDQVNKAKQ